MLPQYLNWEYDTFQLNIAPRFGAVLLMFVFAHVGAPSVLLSANS
jgi:hypothetical protein